MKIAIVTCYKHNDYVRARTLRTAFAAAPDVETIVVRNRHRGLWRYPEGMLKLLKVRFVDRPDAYVLTFRAYELLLLAVLTLVRKPIIYDELINFTEWLDEHGRIKEGKLSYKLFRSWYGWLTKHCRIILADTTAHAQYSAQLNNLPLERYRTLPVAADETVFRPNPSIAKAEPFTVFYYGSMLPLHGLQYVLDAALLLKDKSIRFRVAGGGQAAKQACQAASEQGANVLFEDWVPFEELPKIALTAGLGIGGPFGNTLQSQYVITGKAYQLLALGVPVLIGQNQVSGVFVDKQNSLVVPQADAQAIADAVSWAQAHPKELAALGAAGKKLYAAQFSQAVVNDLVASVVQAL